MAPFPGPTLETEAVQIALGPLFNSTITVGNQQKISFHFTGLVSQKFYVHDILSTMGGSDGLKQAT